jgi:hypothetical protein
MHHVLADWRSRQRAMPLQPNIAILRRIGTWLALLALTLQLAVGTAHHHSGFDAGAHDGPALAGTIDTGATASAPAPASAPDTDENCQICLGLALAAMAILPIAVIVAAAATIGSKPLGALIKIAGRRLGAFCPRAPPLPNCA